MRGELVISPQRRTESLAEHLLRTVRGNSSEGVDSIPRLSCNPLGFVNSKGGSWTHSFSDNKLIHQYSYICFWNNTKAARLCGVAVMLYQKGLVKTKTKRLFFMLGLKSLLSVESRGILLLFFFFFFFFCCFYEGLCLAQDWLRSGSTAPGALSLLCHLISPALHKGELVTWAQFGPL